MVIKINLDDYINEPHAICPMCKSLTSVKDKKLSNHSVTADGAYLKHYDEPPNCPGSNQRVENIKPYGQWINEHKPEPLVFTCNKQGEVFLK